MPSARARGGAPPPAAAGGGPDPPSPAETVGRRRPPRRRRRRRREDGGGGGGPFDVVVVASPDAPSSRAARELIRSSCGPFRADDDGDGDGDGDDVPASSSSASASPPPLISSDGRTLYLSTCDPFGARMGSGGGTIAALAEADDAWRRFRPRGTSSPSSSGGDGECGDGDDDDDDDDGDDDDDDEGPDGARDDDRGPPTVLICHAGGESSRCPTQIALGKAWTSLPVDAAAAAAAGGTGTRAGAEAAAAGSDGDGAAPAEAAVVSNPTALLVASLSRFLSDVPRGSAVVAASDVLLSLDGGDEGDARGALDFGDHDEGDCGSVVGLAVPAPLSTARNHGVYVVDPASASSEARGGGDARIVPCRKVLQKPSIEEMKASQDPPCAFHRATRGGSGTAKEERGGAEAKEEEDDAEEQCAWIDTGAVVFLPRSASTLREMARSSLRRCTRRGLEELYETEGGRASSLEEYARGAATKACLYGDFLPALRLASSSSDDRDVDASPKPGLEALSALSRHELRTCAIPDGTFVHLGTTGELREFLASSTAASGPRSGGGSGGRARRRLARSIGLARRASSFLSGISDASDDAVVVNSVVACGSGSIGEGSAAEHCDLERRGTVRIGDGCVVSGLRGALASGRGTDGGGDLRVPSGLCLQLLPLRGPGDEAAGAAAGRSPSFVCLCLGVRDCIKDAPAPTLYGTDLPDVLRRSGLTPSELWDDAIPPEGRTLWNARIHPVLETNGRAREDGAEELDCSFLEWIAGLRRGEGGAGADAAFDTAAARGLRRWKEARRLSLSRLRDVVDPEAEARYRCSISPERREDRRLREATDVLEHREHVPCNFDYVLDLARNSDGFEGALGRALRSLDAVASRALARGRFDVAGRTFMTVAALLSDVARARGHVPSKRDDGEDARTPEESTNRAIAGLRAPRALLASIATVHDALFSSSGGSFDAACASRQRDFLERAAMQMTERCVSGVDESKKSATLTRETPVPIGTTVRASAPARVDLSGGWSDTPPISCEYGGAVACLAVAVDGRRPLQAQCRMVNGAPGVKLRAESRTLEDNALVSFSEVAVDRLADLADYCDPTAECALLKCALIQLGLASLDDIAKDGGSSIQTYLKAFCQVDRDDVGLEITSQSLLPTGSGMGSSSILGGCVIAAIAKCVGIWLTGVGDTPASVDGDEINECISLIHAVLMLEQLLTTGGGWQDNIGGLVGGLKLGSSDAHVLPLQTKVRRVALSSSTIEELNGRLVLAFSGKPRLAKNILENVLRRWARRSDDIVRTVEGLVRGASKAIECLEANDIDGLGEVVNKYWRSKVAMAGEGSGVEPASVRAVLDLLSAKGDIVGGTLCGAGGGGFLALLTSKGKTSTDILETVEEAKRDGNDLSLDAFSWHKCTISEDGLVVEVNNA